MPEFCVSLGLLYVFIVFFPSINIYFLSTSQEVGWEEYDLFSVKWDIKP